MGHSFGGKVALAYTGRAAPGELEQAGVLDASPGTRHDRASPTEAMVRMLREIPSRCPRASASSRGSARAGTTAPSPTGWR